MQIKRRPLHGQLVADSVLLLLRQGMLCLLDVEQRIL